MLRMNDKDIELIDQAIGNAEGHLFYAEGVAGDFIDTYFATPHYEKDDVSMKELEMIEALRDHINDIYETNSKIAAILDYLRQNEEE